MLYLYKHHLEKNAENIKNSKNIFLNYISGRAKDTTNAPE